MLLHTLRRLILGHQRVGLVRKGENQIGLFLAGVLIGIDQRDAVENVPGIQQENGDGRGQHRGVVCQEADGQELSRACVHKQGHGKGPGQTVAGFAQKNAEADAQEQISGHDRHRIQKYCFKSFTFHYDSSLRGIETAGQDQRSCWRS